MANLGLCHIASGTKLTSLYHMHPGQKGCSSRPKERAGVRGRGPTWSRCRPKNPVRKQRTRERLVWLPGAGPASRRTNRFHFRYKSQSNVGIRFQKVRIWRDRRKGRTQVGHKNTKLKFESLREGGGSTPSLMRTKARVKLFRIWTVGTGRSHYNTLCYIHVILYEIYFWEEETHFRS